MAISSRPAYIFDSGLQVSAQGSLALNAETGVYTFSETQATIEQGEIGTVQVALILPLATFSGGTPLVLFRRQDGYVSGLLTMSTATWVIMVDGVQAQYQVLYITMSAVGWTYTAGRHALQASYLYVDGSYDKIDLVYYTVDDGINNYEEVTADTYEEIATQFNTTYADLLDRMSYLEIFALNGLGYNETGSQTSIPFIKFYHASGLATISFDGTNFILNRNSVDEEVMTVLNNLADLANVIETNLATDDILIYNGTNYVNITKTAFLKSIQDQIDPIDTTYLKKSGGTMSGAIAMGAQKITGLGDGTADTDAVNLGQLNDLFKDVSYVSATGILTFTRFDNTTVTVDLPLELIIESGYYDAVNNDIVLVLANASEIKIPAGDLLTDLDAVNVRYDNTDSGLAATNIKAAIDELESDKIAKDYSSYTELTTDLSENDYIVVRDVSNNLTKKTKVSTLRGFESDTYEYGVREVVGQSASELERVKKVNGEITYGSATGLVANVAIDDAIVSNSFDSIAIFNRIRENITATDLASASVSNTFVKVPKYYIKEEWTTESGTDYHYLWMCSKQLVGYRLPLPFKKPDGSERDYTYMGAYEAFLDGNNKLRSLTGQIPKVTYSRNNFRIAARALDGLGINSKYQITDLAEYVDLVQIPFMIEFATKHSQGVFAGATSMAYSASHTAIADGTAVNFIVVSNATGAAFVLGQTVSIGTSSSNDSIAKDRIITQIDVDTPNAGETTITFDGAAVNITIGHVIASRAWKTGMTDSVKVSGTHALNDGKHSIVWRGLENPFGNTWKNVDGVKISNWRGYVAENPKDYNDTASVGGVYAEPYLPLGYLNANANNYIQELGYDQNYPYAKFPISVQASSGLYFRDYYSQNTGDRTVFVGGDWNSSSGAGLFYWNLNVDLGYAYFRFGARLSYRP